MSLFKELKRRNVIRVLVAYLAGAWLLIQIADVIFPIYGPSEFALQVLITLLGVGLIPVFVVSWAYELTPEGLKRDADVAPGQSIAPQTGRRLDRVIMVVLALALGFFAFDRFALDPARDIAREEAAEQRGRTKAYIESFGTKSIAVLPFENMSSDPEQDYFSDGFAEELLNLLTKIPELRVISRSSAFAYRGDVHLSTVAEELNVAYVLEGSVRKSGNRIRITAQLINARADAHVWSETFERESGDVFDIQDEIAGMVADQLELKLLGRRSESRRTSPEIYDDYLRLKSEVFGSGVEERTIDELRSLVERDPNYVPALNLLGLTYYFTSGISPGDLSKPKEGMRLSNEMIDRALAVDPDDTVANLYYGWHLLEDFNDPQQGARYVEKAYNAEPGNAEVIRVAGAFARVIGHFDKAISLGEMSVALGPRCGNCYWVLGYAYQLAGQYVESERAMRQRLEIVSSGWHDLGDALLLQGKAKAALEAYDSQQEGIGWLTARAAALYSLGHDDQFEETMTQVLQQGGEDYPYDIALAYAWSGDIDNAFIWLENAVKLDYRFLKNGLWDPRLSKLRDDPRWTEFWDLHWYTEQELERVRLNIP